MRKGTRVLGRKDQYLHARQAYAGVQLTRTGISLPLRPTPLSPTYRVRIDYAPERLPRVFVVSPPLMPVSKHRYRGGGLCLYYRQEYDNTMWLTDTIIPWAAQWLQCYEFWQVQGEWPAPESPHGGPNGLSAKAFSASNRRIPTQR